MTSSTKSFSARALAVSASVLLAVPAARADWEVAPKKECAGSPPSGGPVAGCKMTLSACWRRDGEVEVFGGRDASQQVYAPEEFENCRSTDKSKSVTLGFPAAWDDSSEFSGDVAEPGVEDGDGNWDGVKDRLRDAVGFGGEDIGPRHEVTFDIPPCKMVEFEAEIAYREDVRAVIEHGYWGVFKGPRNDPDTSSEWSLVCNYNCDGYELGYAGPGEVACAKLMSESSSGLRAQIGTGVRESFLRSSCDGPCGDDDDRRGDERR